ncbi:MAG: hypothetical protein IKF98_00025 [Clostridia bacterium]|nr:hypothetical protein [Clostridia bacterium]
MKIEDLKDKKGKPLYEGHRSRLRTRLEREGWDALRPFEMVEVVLCHAMPRQDLSAVSRLLVDRFGTVGGVFSASREALLTVPGVTSGMAEWIRLTGELILAYRQLHNVSDIRLDCYQKVMAFLNPMLPQKREAGLWVLYSDYNFNLITITDLRESEVWWAAENIRRMVMDAIGHGARYVYMVLWKDRPDQGMDDTETARLNAIASVLCAADLDLVDCLLVNSEENYSMRVNGHMNRFKATASGNSLRETYTGEQTGKR